MIFTLALMGAIQPCIAQFPPFQWARQSGAFGGRGTATDRQGNCFVTGRFFDTVNFDTVSITSTGGSDIFLAKYDTRGAIQWVQTVGGSSGDDGYAVATDLEGNCYLTGDFGSTATFGPTNLTSLGDYDVFLAKYNEAGVVQWVQRFGGTNRDIGYGVSVDGAGNSYLGGYFSGTAYIGTNSVTSAGGREAFLAKFNSNGEFQWLRRAGSSGDDMALAISANTDGDCFVAGTFAGTASFGPTNVTARSGVGFFLAKYWPDGELHWVVSGGGNGNNSANGVGTDNRGNCYVTASVGYNAQLGSTNLPTSSDSILTAKYDSMGVLQWIQLGISYTGLLRSQALAVDANGNSCVAGVFSKEGLFGTNTIVGKSMDAFAVAYDSDGTLQWVYRMGSTNADYARAVAMDGLGNCYVTGDFYDVAQFGSLSLTGTNTSSMYIAKIASGLPLLSIAQNRNQPEQMHFSLKANKGTSWRIDFTHDWYLWSPLATLTNVQGSTNFTCNILEGETNRFYRAVMVP